MSDTLAQIGEHPLIERLVAGLPSGAQIVLGAGDDAAVLRFSGDVVISTDTMVEDVHFKRAWSTPHDVGRKAAASSIADIEAMGARPVALVVALSVAQSESVDWIQGLRDGIVAECGRAGAQLVGGDISSGPVPVITCTVLGDMGTLRPVTRSGAKPGQVIAYAGRLGMAHAGWMVLRRGFRSPAAVVDAHRVPQPPYGQGAVAALAGATSMIDISDGLVADLGHVAKASSVELRVDTGKLPIHEAQATVGQALGGADPVEFLLVGGDDHALVATFDPAAVPDGWRVIGEVRAGEPGVLVDGEPWSEAGGWDHFTAR
ncbi:MAG: thiamine-phosphate kinase [Propionibacteriaceae bacterium]|nr:thiamine-phosphate kinase [Propionibacteriaceae bacterium]